MRYLLFLFFTFSYFRIFSQDCAGDSINPWYLNFNPNVTLSCNADLSSVIPDVVDNCDTLVDLLYYEEVFPGDCPGSINIFRVYRAFDNQGNQVVESQNIYIVDESAPSFLDTQSQIVMECGSQDTIPYPGITDNCSSEIVLTYQDSEVQFFGCDSSFSRVWVATDECGNTSYFNQNISFLDLTEPFISNCPPDLTLNLGEILPEGYEILVSDNCDSDLNVQYEEFYLGDTTSECSISTPPSYSGGNCDIIVNGTVVDWGMQLINLPVTHRFYSVQSGQLTEVDSNSIRITATMVNVFNEQNGFLVDVTFSGGYSWQEWSSLPYPTSFKADCNGSGSNYDSWIYYILNNTDGAELVGFGDYTGSSLSLTHAPSNQYFGFQYGNGANNYNSSNNGFGGWFNYAGVFPLQQGQFSPVYGAGDFAFDTDCSSEYTLVRQWTVTDCSGNSSFCSQRIQFTNLPNTTNEGNPSIDLPAKEVERKEGVEVQITNRNIFFKNLADDAGVVEIYDANGKKCFEKNVLSENTMSFDSSNIASGLYTYVFYNKNIVESGNFLVEN